MSVSNRKRWIVPWKDSRTKPAIYHCLSRVVDRRFAFEVDEREHFRMLMRMCEKFTGCRVLSYCVMSNHFHILLEVPPIPEDGISDEELFQRLGVFYSETQVAEIAKQMAEAATPRSRGEFEIAPVDENGGPLTKAQEVLMAKKQAAHLVSEIRSRYTRRMHNLSEFMKSLLERFTKWFNRMHSRSGTLWEERYKSVIVEDGAAARMMAAYMDLNPVRAGMVSDPAEYRWSSYGEAVGGGMKGNETVLKDLKVKKMLRCRIRYFTDGAVIGSKEFVNEVFVKARERFGKKRKDGARKLKGRGAAASGILWSLRDLQKGIA